MEPKILPTEHDDPARYPAGSVYDIWPRESTVADICDFIVEYINSDVLVGSVIFSWVSIRAYHLQQGLLSDRHLVIAGKSLFFP
jgi:hypothetical protein